MPKQTELQVMYSSTIKASLPHDRFENNTVTEYISETWSVDDLDEPEIILLEQTRRDYLRGIIEARIKADYAEIKEP